MKVSICITTFNEEKSINKLLDSLFSQTKLANEIIIVDGGSTDKTIELISKAWGASRVKKFKKIKLIISKGASIAKGRNLAIKNSKYEIIAMTDGGCICDKYWLAKITEPFKKDINVVAGFYEMTGKSDFQKALKPYLGVMPNQFDDETFLPSARSIAFRKSVWKKVGGFNEKLDRAGEDTDFNLKILKKNFQIARAKKAIVDWEVPETLLAAMKKFFYYARGDAQIGGLTKHNIKVVTIFLRYILFFIFWLLFPIYLIWSTYKHRKYTKNWRQKIYTAIIQVASDISIMAGFLNGLL